MTLDDLMSRTYEQTGSYKQYGPYVEADTNTGFFVIDLRRPVTIKNGELVEDNIDNELPTHTIYSKLSYYKTLVDEIEVEELFIDNDCYSIELLTPHHVRKLVDVYNLGYMDTVQLYKSVFGYDY